MGKCLFMRKGETHTAPGSRLPSGYTELAYIQSSGTQYINTGFKQNQNSRVVMHVKPVSITANAWAFGGRNANGNNGKGVFFSYSERLWNAVYYEGNTSVGKSFSGISSTADLNIDYDKNTCTINGVSVNFTAKTFKSDFNITLLACNTGGTVAGHLSAKLYSCQIYDNDVLVRDFVPCINASGEVGLYDLVGKQFYGNAGTGVFTGSEVE